MNNRTAAYRGGAAEERKSETSRRLEKTAAYIISTIRDGSRGVDVPLLLIIIALNITGLVMMYSASYAYAYVYKDGNSSYYIVRQVVFAIIGGAAAFLLSFFPVRNLKRYNLPILLISWGLLGIVLLLPEIEHVHRWINLGFTTFQPSEIAKFAIILFCATWADSHSNRMGTFKGGILPFGIVLGITAGLLMCEPHLSCTILVLLIAATLMFVGGSDWKWLIGVMGSAAGMLAIMVFSGVSYFKNRVDVWLDPFSDYLGNGWQNIQALYAISNGGLLGQGLGNSRQKYLYISEPQNDFIYAVICEELGFIGSVLIVIAFIALVWRGFTLSVSNPDRFSRLLGIGITAQIGWQTLLNIAVVTKSIPNTGISLPFFSYGGTSLLMLLAEMGILLAITRDSTKRRIL